MAAPPLTGTGGTSGLLTAYASVAAATINTAGVNLLSVTVAGPYFFDVAVTAWLGSTTTGTGSVDGLNIGLYSDPVTGGTMVLQTIVPWNHLGFASVPEPQEYRIYALTTLALTSMGAATNSTNYCVNIVTTRAEPGDAII